MQITIIGSGAMACFLGAKLNALGQLSLFGHWPEQLATIQQNGLLVEEPDGRQARINLHITDKLANIPPADLVLILVKSRQTTQAAHEAAHLQKPSGLVLTLQNGLGNWEALTAVLGEDQVALGITSSGAAIVKPGHVRIAGMGQTHLAQKQSQAAQLQTIISLFRQAGFPTQLTADPDSLVWGKLAVNAGINPLTSILRVPNGFLAENQTARQLMMQAAEEVTAVAQQLHITLPYENSGEQALQVAQNTASNHSSMLQDVERGAKTEIEAICGAVVRYGREHNIPTPVNLAFYRCLQKIENGAWQWEPDPEKTLALLQSIISKLEETP